MSRRDECAGRCDGPARPCGRPCRRAGDPCARSGTLRLPGCPGSGRGTRDFDDGAAPREQWHRVDRGQTRPTPRVWGPAPVPRRTDEHPPQIQGRGRRRAAPAVEGVAPQGRRRARARATIRLGTVGGRRCVRAHAAHRPTGRGAAPGRSQSHPGRGLPPQLDESGRAHLQRCRAWPAPRWPRRSPRESHRTTEIRSTATGWLAEGPSRKDTRSMGAASSEGDHISRAPASAVGRARRYSTHGIIPRGTPSRKGNPRRARKKANSRSAGTACMAMWANQMASPVRRPAARLVHTRCRVPSSSATAASRSTRTSAWFPQPVRASSRSAQGDATRTATAHIAGRVCPPRAATAATAPPIPCEMRLAPASRRQPSRRAGAGSGLRRPRYQCSRRRSPGTAGRTSGLRARRRLHCRAGIPSLFKPDDAPGAECDVGQGCQQLDQKDSPEPA